MKILGVTGLGGLWPVEWAWHLFLDQSIGMFFFGPIDRFLRD